MPTTTWRVATRAGHRLHVRDHVPDGPVDGRPGLLHALLALGLALLVALPGLRGEEVLGPVGPAVAARRRPLVGDHRGGGELARVCRVALGERGDREGAAGDEGRGADGARMSQ